jgi:hypothetical protein
MLTKINCGFNESFIFIVAGNIIIIAYRIIPILKRAKAKDRIEYIFFELGFFISSKISSIL